MGATRPASGQFHTLNKGSQTALITRLSVSLCLNARRETRAPIRACVWCLRLVLTFRASV